MYLLAFIISYLLGSVNTSIVISKILSKTDIRNYGSGNAGATNVLRTLGKKAAVIVVVGDLLKGIIAVVISSYICPEFGELIGGIGAVLGHNFPVYFKFKGGKGIVTSAAVIMMINWKIGLVLLAVSIFVIAVTKIVSLGSIIGSMLYPVFVVFLDNRGKEYIIFAIIIALLAIIMHRANIKRLLRGEESKIGSKIKVKDE